LKAHRPRLTRDSIVAMSPVELVLTVAASSAATSCGSSIPLPILSAAAPNPPAWRRRALAVHDQVDRRVGELRCWESAA
jgi:hypothetical protein